MFQNLVLHFSRDNFLSKIAFKHVTKINYILCITRNTIEHFPIHLHRFSVAKLSCICCTIIAHPIWSRKNLNSFMHSEKHISIMGEWSKMVRRKEGNVCGLRAILAEGRHLSWWYCNTCVKGLFWFIILLCFTLISALALSLRLKELIHDYINVVTNLFLCLFLTFFSLWHVVIPKFINLEFFIVPH